MHCKFSKLLIIPCKRILNLQLFFFVIFLHLRILRLCKYIQMENNPWLLKLKHSQIIRKEIFEFYIKGSVREK